MSRWLACCSHGDCDIMVQIVVFLPLDSRVLSVVPRVCSGPKVPDL